MTGQSAEMGLQTSFVFSCIFIVTRAGAAHKEVFMSKPRKLKSGSWNVQVYDYRDASGKAHFKSITAPTKLECEYQAKLYQRENASRGSARELTVGGAVDKYIELCGVLSPCTSTAYRRMRETMFPALMQAPVRSLSAAKVQRAINAECFRECRKTGRVITPKTVKNEWGLISAALKKICGLSFEVKLPKVVKDRRQFPDPEVVLAAIMDCPERLPCLLSIWCTFSMSELLGVRCSSVRDGYIYIERVRVYTDQGWVEKAIAKNATRNRVQRLPELLLDMIRETPAFQRYLETGEDGYLFPGSRSKIYNAWTRTAARHGLELSFHDLRHMAASVMLQLNVPPKYAQERGGWSTSSVMQTVYQHTFSAQRLAVDALVNDYFTESLNALYEREGQKR